MAEKLDNQFIPKFIPSDLKWNERDGLDTWYLKGKCKDFFEDTDEHFKRTKIFSFDKIKNFVPKDKLVQYQQIDHQMIMCYPPNIRQEIFLSIFRNANRNDMFVQKETINEHFKKEKSKTGIGRGKFLKKKLEMIVMLESGEIVNLFVLVKKIRMSDNTYGSVILHVESW